ncbi:hypothetical protein CLIB1423_36S00320 [[Candida] railenensis]|uniref:Uncharacterized protein n=1 Tax=[Candida] railenensis TaxID=45579 RepID=A0A9P0QVL9_9ASCO|nr:hypothetical protein CLIB1423_36S00320 [[Candida] railenensis]
MNRRNNAYNTFQKHYIDSLLPVGNLENLQTIDDFLYQIESTIARSDDYIPSSVIFSVLLTLSVESITINRRGTTAIDGVVPSSASISSEISRNYDDSYSAPVHMRALSILNRYLKLTIMQIKGGQDSSTFNEIKAMFMQFLILRSSKRGLRNVHKVNYDVVNQFERILNEKLVDSSQENSRSKYELDNDIVSDSEEELEVISQPFMQSELKRFHQRSSKTSNLPTPPNGVSETSALLEGMPHMETRSPTPGTSNQVGILEIFGEDLLPYKLNPLNESYDFWQLLQWCLNCNNSVIYSNYNKILSWMIDFVILDYRKYINGSNKSDESSVLLVCLLHQLSSKRIDWHDRLVEFTMSGLTSLNKCHPCYKREKWWKTPTKQQTFELAFPQFSLHTDSTVLRTKILLMVYIHDQYSKEFPNKLVKLVAPKVFQSPLNVIRQFFVKYHDMLKYFPNSELAQFYLELSIYLLREYNIDIPVNGSKAVGFILNLMSDKLVFKDFVLETFQYSSLGEFTEEKEKFQFLVGCMLQSVSKIVDTSEYLGVLKVAHKMSSEAFIDLESSLHHVKSTRKGSEKLQFDNIIRERRRHERVRRERLHIILGLGTKPEKQQAGKLCWPEMQV